MNLSMETLLTRERVIELHAIGIARHSQASLAIGKPSEDCVDGKIGNAWTSEAYRNEDEDTVPGLCFAGYLLYYLVRGHCFPDGNKRVSWAASMEVLTRLGLTVEATEDEAYELVIAIAEGKIDNGIHVVQWISRRLRAPD